MLVVLCLVRQTKPVPRKLTLEQLPSLGLWDIQCWEEGGGELGPEARAQQGLQTRVTWGREATPHGVVSIATMIRPAVS